MASTNTGKVLGVGGVFFKAPDLAAVKAWYVRVLGFDVTEWGGTLFPPLPHGFTVWSPFAADSDYFAPSTAPVMLNLMVDDLDAVLARVRAQGVEVLKQDDSDPSGRFAWIMDPTGLKLELWQPTAATIDGGAATP
jgi:catechol 2,3-dioxygenase-like lactoylglutathione lyase family enzyme